MSDVKVNWFEIPVSDVAKAAEFYTKVLNCQMIEMQSPNGPMRAFLHGEQPVGALVAGEQGNPGGSGISLYLDATGDIEGVLSRAEANGGKVGMPKTSIGDYGAIGALIDPDGNLVGLHSMPG